MTRNVNKGAHVITPQETRTSQQLKCKLKVKVKKDNLSKQTFQCSQCNRKVISKRTSGNVRNFIPA